MEHLPWVSKPYQPVEVPYLGGEWDNGDFEGFPTRQGIPFQSLRPDQFQAWLFFGLIQGVLQTQVYSQDFCRQTEDGRLLITTSKLREYLNRWKIEHEKAKTNSDRLNERRTQSIHCLRHSYEVRYELGGLASIVGDQIDLSIQLLALALQHAVTSVPQGPRKSKFKRWIDNTDVPWTIAARNTFLESKMIADGWCPVTIESTIRTGNLSFLCYLSLYEPSKMRDHRKAGCKASDKSCRLLNIQSFDYRTLHVGHCQCQFLMPNMAEICSIIKDGGIPILYLESTGKHAELKVVRYQRGKEYTAISHVWADGLGNRQSNSLPQCQIEKMITHISRLPYTPTPKKESVQYDDQAWMLSKPTPESHYLSSDFKCMPKYFWIDTICVPLKPEDIKQAAIINMQNVYKSANRVLVLDADLLRAQISASNPDSHVAIREDVSALITVSTWSKRFWTLQEGVLPKRLWFQFANDAYEKRYLSKCTDENVSEFFYDSEVGAACDETDYHWRQGFPTRSKVSQVSTVWSALKNRAASNENDIPICVAILLDMDVQKIVEAPNRVKTLWEMYKVIPAGLFCFPAPKLLEKHLRWALKHLEMCGGTPSPRLQPAYITSQGVSITLHGLTFHISPEHQPQSLIPVFFNGQTYFIRQNLMNENEPWTSPIPDLSIDFSCTTHLGVILGQDLDDNLGSRPPLVAALGALVAIVKSEEETLVVTYLRAVSIVAKGSTFDTHPRIEWTEIEQEEKKGVALEAEAKGTDQRWLIVPTL